MDKGKDIVKAAAEVRHGVAPKLSWRERLRVELWARYGRRLRAREVRHGKAAATAAAYDRRHGGPAAALSHLLYVDEAELGPAERARRRAAEHEQRQAAQREADAQATAIMGAESFGSLPRTGSHGYTTPNDA